MRRHKWYSLGVDGYLTWQGGVFILILTITAGTIPFILKACGI